ncbi:MAG: type II toxin-antitoxin system RelE/ParE family toxin [Acidobacteria bacterium]|nr:MAG: type II toxin-antitoxin system RelE/ParE family toxin [Acidobacteriota bacterium]
MMLRWRRFWPTPFSLSGCRRVRKRLETGGVVLSSEYRIFETERFRKDIKAIALGGDRRVLEKLCTTVYGQLRIQPKFGPQIKKLKGFTPETWRYRIGAWRFFYEVDDKEMIVFLTVASHRGSAY